MTRRIRGADLRRFGSALRGPRRISVLRALVDGALVVVTLKRRGLRPLLRDDPPSATQDADRARAIAAAVDDGMVLLPLQPTCLRRSVVLLRELQRNDVRGDLRLGVRRGRNGVEAHAWIEVAGEVVNDDPDEVRTYARLSAAEAERAATSLT